LKKVYALIEAGGHQYRVKEGDTIRIQKYEGSVGEELKFDKVLMVSNEGDVKVGKPFVEGASVTAKIDDQGKEKKILVMKFKRRKGYRRKNGHRQLFTQVRIEKISVA
jgi:large subunit ribosomal protein L21